MGHNTRIRWNTTICHNIRIYLYSFVYDPWYHATFIMPLLCRLTIAYRTSIDNANFSATFKCPYWNVLPTSSFYKFFFACHSTWWIKHFANNGMLLPTANYCLSEVKPHYRLNQNCIIKTTNFAVNLVFFSLLAETFLHIRFTSKMGVIILFFSIQLIFLAFPIENIEY